LATPGRLELKKLTQNVPEKSKKATLEYNFFAFLKSPQILPRIDTQDQKWFADFRNIYNNGIGLDT
jgi:hypothetical protein